MNMIANSAKPAREFGDAVSGWCNVLAELNNVFDASGSAFAVHYYADKRGRLVYPVGIRESSVAAYESRYGALNPWLRDRNCLEVRDTTNGGAWLGTARVSAHALTESRFYREWLEPQGLMHALFGLIGVHDQTLISLLLLRRAADREFDGTDAANLAFRLPLLSSLWSLQRQARASSGHAAAMGVALDQSRAAIILIDRHKRVAGMNERARIMLKRERAVRIRDHCFCAADSATQRRLSDILDSLFSAAGGSNERVSKGLSIRRAGDRRKLSLIASTLGSPPRWDGDEWPFVALYLFDSEEQSDLRVEWLQDLYGLSCLESRIAMCLCRGLTQAEVADHLCASIHTVRSYMKEIFHKVGVRRQSELVGRLLMGPGLLAGVEGRPLQRSR